MKRGVSETGEIEEDESELFEINVSIGGGKLSTIKEELEDRSLIDDRSLFSFDFRGDVEDIVHVAISGESSSNNNYSMEALIWTLKSIAVARPCSRNNSVVFLVHIYPQLRFIPTPLGNFPMSKANPEQKQLHLQLEMMRRQEYLQKFIDLCFSSQVKVEILSIESDSEAKALVDLIPILNMRKLVIGIPFSKNMKKKSTGMTRMKRNGLTDYVVKNAPKFCEVKIICGGEEVIWMSYVDSSTTNKLELISPSSSHSSSSSSSSSSTSLSPSPSLNNNLIPPSDHDHDQDHRTFLSFQFCKCLS